MYEIRLRIREFSKKPAPWERDRAPAPTAPPAPSAAPSSASAGKRRRTHKDVLDDPDVKKVMDHSRGGSLVSFDEIAPPAPPAAPPGAGAGQP